MDLGKVNIPTVIVAVLMVFVLLSLSSVFSIMKTPSPKEMRKLQKEMCDELKYYDDNKLIEDFGNEEALVKRSSNDDFFTFSKFENHTKSYNFKSIPLTAPSTEDHYPTNLLLGKADRYYFSKDGVETFYLEVYCNLFVLGGDPFDKTDLTQISQKYSVYLLHDSGNKMYIGDLTKDGDGVYKLKTNNQSELLKNVPVTSLMSFNKMNVTFKQNGQEQVLLEGVF